MTVFIAPVRDGKPMFSLVQRKLMEQTFRELNGQDVKVTIGKETRPRTLRQNSYYWGVVLAYVAAETGHTTKEMHWYFKDLYLPKKWIEMGGFKRAVPPSTTELDTKTFTDFIERVRVFAAEFLHLSIPDPKTSGYE